MRLLRLAASIPLALATLVPQASAHADSTNATLTSAALGLDSGTSDDNGNYDLKVTGTALSSDLVTQVANTDGSWGEVAGQYPVDSADTLQVSDSTHAVVVLSGAPTGRTFALRLLHPDGTVVPGVVTVTVGHGPSSMRGDFYATTSGVHGTSTLYLSATDYDPSEPPVTGGTATVDGQTLPTALAPDSYAPGYWSVSVPGMRPGTTYDVSVTLTNRFGSSAPMEVHQSTDPVLRTTAQVRVLGLSSGAVKAGTSVTITGNVLVNPSQPVPRTWPAQVVLHVKDATGERTHRSGLPISGDPDGPVPAGGGDPVTWHTTIRSSSTVWVTFDGDDGAPVGSGAHLSLAPSSSPIANITVMGGTVPPAPLSVATAHLAQRVFTTRVRAHTTVTSTVTLTAGTHTTKPLLAAKVTLWANVGHGWLRLASASTGRDGRAQAHVTLARTTRLQWRYAGAAALSWGTSHVRVTAGRSSVVTVHLG